MMNSIDDEESTIFISAKDEVKQVKNEMKSIYLISKMNSTLRDELINYLFFITMLICLLLILVVVIIILITGIIIPAN